VGNSLISGAIEKAYAKKNTRLDNFLQVRPFPRDIADHEERAAIWHRYRQELLSLPGIALFFLGNKEVDGAILPADGVRKEFEIARAQGVAAVPVGATGSMASELTAETLASPAGLSPTLLAAITALNQPIAELNNLLQPTIDAVKALSAE
jgi:hypothetical protein